jgi:hypothetical protein
MYPITHSDMLVASRKRDLSVYQFKSDDSCQPCDHSNGFTSLNQANAYNLAETTTSRYSFYPDIQTIEVDDLAATLERVKLLGGEILSAVFDFPGIGCLAYFKDPKGTILGAMQVDTSASALLLM